MFLFKPYNRTAVREVAGSNLRQKCYLSNDICKWVDFSDKDDKTVGPVSQYWCGAHQYPVPTPVPGPTPCSERVWNEVPGVMVRDHLFCSGGICVSYYSL